MHGHSYTRAEQVLLLRRFKPTSPARQPRDRSYCCKEATPKDCQDLQKKLFACANKSGNKVIDEAAVKAVVDSERLPTQLHKAAASCRK